MSNKSETYNAIIPPQNNSGLIGVSGNHSLTGISNYNTWYELGSQQSQIEEVFYFRDLKSVKLIKRIIIKNMFDEWCYEDGKEKLFKWLFIVEKSDVRLLAVNSKEMNGSGVCLFNYGVHTSIATWFTLGSQNILDFFTVLNKLRNENKVIPMGIRSVSSQTHYDSCSTIFFSEFR